MVSYFIWRLATFTYPFSLVHCLSLYQLSKRFRTADDEHIMNTENQLSPLLKIKSSGILQWTVLLIW